MPATHIPDVRPLVAAATEYVPAAWAEAGLDAEAVCPVATERCHWGLVKCCQAVQVVAAVNGRQQQHVTCSEAAMIGALSGSNSRLCIDTGASTPAAIRHCMAFFSWQHRLPQSSKRGALVCLTCR